MPNNSGLFLGIDFGTKRIGIAVGQSITQNASPLKTILNSTMLLQEMKNLIQEWQPQGLIIGLALQPDGSDSPTSLKARAWGESLHVFEIPIYYIEERLTSVEAQHLLKKNKNLSYDKDAVAASLILQSWFNTSLMERDHAN